MHNKKQVQKGFSLVELVMVIVLISVLAIGGFSMFASRSSYATFVAKDLFISQALLAQLHALGSQQVMFPVNLTVSVSDTEWAFTLSKTAVAEQKRVTVKASGNILQVDGSTLSSGDSHTFEWSRHASLRSAVNHQISFVGDNPYTVCLSAEGFPYERAGACP